MATVIKSSVNFLKPKTQIERILGNGSKVISTYKVSECKKELLSFSRRNKDKFPAIQFGDVLVRVSDTARVVIKDDFTCKGCGKEAEFISVYKTEIDDSTIYGMIFYHVENDKVINHTKDHIVPKSLGGKDTFNNYQDLCVVCNHEKDNTDTEIYIPKITRSKELSEEEVYKNRQDNARKSLRYPIRRFTLNWESLDKLYNKEAVSEGNVTMLDTERYESLLLAEDALNSIIRDAYSYNLRDEPWYVKFFGLGKLIESYIDKYKDHIFCESFTKIEKYFKLKSKSKDNDQ